MTPPGPSPFPPRTARMQTLLYTVCEAALSYQPSLHYLWLLVVVSLIASAVVVFILLKRAMNKLLSLETSRWEVTS